MSIGSFCVDKGNKLITLQPKSLRITGTQKGFIQCLEIYQSIQSEEDLDQVSYVFPTDNNLCIYSMKFQVGDETITAELRSTKAAKETFEEAKKIGRTAVIAEEVAPGITSVKIGNVPKDKTVAIIFNCSFASTLSNPTTILTKIPLQASEPDGSVTDLYDLPSLEIDLDINISQLQPISDVYTNCESEYAKIDDCNGKLTIKSAIFTDENILIMTEFPTPIQSQMIQTNNSTAISIIPEFETATNTTKEFVFLIDCSASMIGESLRKAKESLHIFLSKLPPDSYFNIIRFGTKFDKLFESSQKVSDSNFEKAKNYVDQMKANLGGTEMLTLFNELFEEKVKTGDKRQIFIITDGEVYERQKVIQKVAENNGFNRIFAIGLGHGADAGFLDEIASITNGKSDFVFNVSELPEKVSEQFDLSLMEACTSTELHIEGDNSFEAVPYPLPPLLPRVVSHVFVSSQKQIESVMIVGHLKSGDQIENVISLSSNMNLAEGEKSPVFALFAQKQLKVIEKEIGEKESSESDEKDDKKVEKLIKLSLESGVMCKETSYVAASQNSYVQQQKQQGRSDVDYDVADRSDGSSWRIIPESVEYDDYTEVACMPKLLRKSHAPRMFFAAAEAAPPPPMMDMCYACEMPMIESACLSSASRSYAPTSPSFEPEPEECCDFDEAPSLDACPPPPMAPAPEPEERPPPPPPESDEKFEIDTKSSSEPAWNNDVSAIDVVRLQSRDGFWDLPSSFVTGKCGGSSVEIGVDLSESPIVKKRVVSTVFSLAYLMKFFQDSKGKWRFAKEKGLRWLRRIEASINWDEIIDNLINSISK